MTRRKLQNYVSEESVMAMKQLYEYLEKKPGNLWKQVVLVFLCYFSIGNWYEGNLVDVYLQ